MNTKIRIVVLQRGWIVVGEVAEETETVVRLERASVIRRWGTTNGLGQIAVSGPTPETKLDTCGTVRAHPLAVVMQIDANYEAWNECL